MMFIMIALATLTQTKPPILVRSIVVDIRPDTREVVIPIGVIQVDKNAKITYDGRITSLEQLHANIHTAKFLVIAIVERSPEGVTKPPYKSKILTFDNITDLDNTLKEKTIVLDVDPERPARDLIKGNVFSVDVGSKQILLVHPVEKGEEPKPSSMLVLDEKTEIWKRGTGSKGDLTIKDIAKMVNDQKSIKAVAIIENTKTGQRNNKFRAVALMVYEQED